MCCTPRRPHSCCHVSDLNCGPLSEVKVEGHAKSRHPAEEEAAEHDVAVISFRHSWAQLPLIR